MAHRRAARRADRARVVVRGPVPTGLALLLRPHRRGPGPRAGLRAPGDQLASALVRGLLTPPDEDSSRVSPHLLPARHHPRSLGADQHGRHRRGVAHRRSGRGRRGDRRADARPAGVDPAPGAADPRRRAERRRAEPRQPGRVDPGQPRRRSAPTTPTACARPGSCSRSATASSCAAPSAPSTRRSARWARWTSGCATSGSTSRAHGWPAVSDDGTEVLRRPGRGPRRAEVETVVDGAADLQAPAWDYRDRCGSSTATAGSAGAAGRRRTRPRGHRAGRDPSCRPGDPGLARRQPSRCGPARSQGRPRARPAHPARRHRSGAEPDDPAGAVPARRGRRRGSATWGGVRRRPCRCSATSATTSPRSAPSRSTARPPGSPRPASAGGPAPWCRLRWRAVPCTPSPGAASPT